MSENTVITSLFKRGRPNCKGNASIPARLIRAQMPVRKDRISQWSPWRHRMS